MLLSVDPGVRGCGVAIFDYTRPAGDHLTRAAYVHNPLKWGQDAKAASCMAWAVAEWVSSGPGAGGVLDLAIECPQVRDAAFQKGDQNTSIIPLTLIVGAVAACRRFRDITQYFPRDWKGTIDPNAVLTDIENRLHKDERARVQLPTASLAHNVWDGIGVGLKCLGRFEPRRVFHKE